MDLSTLMMFLVFYPHLGSNGAALLVYPPLFHQFSFLGFSLFLVVTADFLLRWKFNQVFDLCTYWSSSGNYYIIGTLRGSAFVNGFASDELFIWVLSWFTCWSLSWYDPWMSPSEVLLGVLLLWKKLLWISMPHCVNVLVLLVGFLVFDYAIHHLNSMQHEFLILWKTFLACWNLWGKLYSVWYSFRSCFWDVSLMGYAVFHLWYYVLDVFSMWCPWWYIFWPIVNYYSYPWWG